MDPDSIKEVSQADTQILATPTVVQTITRAKPIANGEAKNWQGCTIEAVLGVQPEARSCCRTTFSSQGTRQRLHPYLRRQALLFLR
jgi:hypothetical protein